jgi:hypothetical protein
MNLDMSTTLSNPTEDMSWTDSDLASEHLGYIMLVSLDSERML